MSGPRLTLDQFHALELWIHAKAKLIAADVAGHHVNTIAKHMDRCDQRRREAFDALVEPTHPSTQACEANP